MYFEILEMYQHFSFLTLNKFLFIRKFWLKFLLNILTFTFKKSKAFIEYKLSNK